MIVFYKNYKRSDRTFLSIQSVKYLFPNIDVRCLFLFDKDVEEYSEDIKKFEELGVKCYTDFKKYNFGSNTAAGSKLNGYYFTEGINKIQSITKNIDDKVLILDEDSYFTTGDTIKFLLEYEFDLAWCNWHAPNTSKYSKVHQGLNGSILAINPNKLNNLFPIPEFEEYIENILGYELYDKCLENEHLVIKIPTRIYSDYCGDGTHTNNINEIILELTKANIPFKQL
jgi:hypothetical protein